MTPPAASAPPSPAKARGALGSTVVMPPRTEAAGEAREPGRGSRNPTGPTMLGYALTDDTIAHAKTSPGDTLASTAPSTSTHERTETGGRTTPVMVPPPAPGGGAPPYAPASPPFGSAKRTMVGIAIGDLARPAPAAPDSVPNPPPNPGAAFDFRKGTMLGIAVPGIAPLSTSVEAPRPALHGTMMGVAIPGIAPASSSSVPPAGIPGPMSPGTAPRTEPRKAVEIVPMPAPLVDDEPEIGPAPQRIKRGLPLAWVAGVVAVLVVLAGGGVLLWLRNAPLIAQPRLDAQGHEVLHLTCASCQEGTVAELYGARATFKNKEADLAIANPLKVGNNPLAIIVDRPNLGRDESVHVIVPVTFRIRADLGDLAATRPAITVRVEALAGTVINVDGKPVALDGNGNGTYSVDISSETEGPADEIRMIDRVIPYVITPSAREAEAGKLTVRVGIAPLHLDAPGLHAVVESATFRLAGRTVPGGKTTANGTEVHMETDGTFAQPFDIRSVGELPVEVRASAPQLASRVAHFVVKRVEHLAEEAKAREAAPEATYDSIVSDLKVAVGKTTIVQGDVIESRTTSAQMIGVVDDTRGCTSAPCLVRVTYGGDTRFKHGDTLRAYGRVTRSVAYGSSTVPEVEADFVQLGRAPRR